MESEYIRLLPNIPVQLSLMLTNYSCGCFDDLVIQFEDDSSKNMTYIPMKALTLCYFDYRFFIIVKCYKNQRRDILLLSKCSVSNCVTIF